MTTLQSADVLLGRTPEGARVFVSVTLESLEGERETTEHARVSGGWRLSLQGHVIDKGHRDASSAGQILADVESVRGVSARLLDIWRAWHLNDMQAGCAHVVPVLQSDGRVDLQSTPACPVSGYRYGHAWLYEPLPDDVLSWARTFIAAHPAA